MWRGRTEGLLLRLLGLWGWGRRGRCGRRCRRRDRTGWAFCSGGRGEGRRCGRRRRSGGRAMRGSLRSSGGVEDFSGAGVDEVSAGGVEPGALGGQEVGYVALIDLAAGVGARTLASSSPPPFRGASWRGRADLAGEVAARSAGMCVDLRFDLAAGLARSVIERRV